MQNEKPDPLLVRHEPPLGWLTLNRPEVRNALNVRTWNLIAEGMTELEADPEVRAVVMHGVTPEAFISGADISEFKDVMPMPSRRAAIARRPTALSPR